MLEKARIIPFPSPRVSDVCQILLNSRDFKSLVAWKPVKNRLDTNAAKARMSGVAFWISESFAAGGAESAFTGIGYNDKLFWMIGASVFMVAQRLRIATKKHFFDSNLDIVRKKINSNKYTNPLITFITMIVTSLHFYY